MNTHAHNAARKAPAPLPGSPAATGPAFGKIAAALGVTPFVLARFGVKSTDTPASAAARIKAAVGPETWERACSAGGTVAASTVLLSRRAEPPADHEDEDEDEDEDQDQGEDGARKCKACKAPASDDARFCTKCGAPLDKPKGEPREKPADDREAAIAAAMREPAVVTLARTSGRDVRTVAIAHLSTLAHLKAHTFPTFPAPASHAPAAPASPASRAAAPAALPAGLDDAALSSLAARSPTVVTVVRMTGRDANAAALAHVRTLIEAAKGEPAVVLAAKTTPGASLDTLARAHVRAQLAAIAK